MSVVVTKFPSTTTAIVAGWTNPANAYAEDGVNTYASPPDENTVPEQKYGGWNFTESDIPPGSTITKVEMGCKHYETDPTGYYQYTGLKYVNSAGSPTSVDLTKRTSLTWDWWTITSYESSWDLTKLNNADVRIYSKLISSSGGGCLVESEDEKSFLLLKDGERWLIKPVGEIKVGDKLFVWHPEQGFKIEPVTAITVYEGEFNVIEVWFGRIKLPRIPDKTEFVDWVSHVTVTENHPLMVFKKTSNTAEKVFAGPFILPAGELRRRMMDGEDFWIGCHWGPKPLEVRMFPIEKCALRTYRGKVYNIKTADKDCRLFAKTLHKSQLEFLEKWGYTPEKEAEIGPPFLAVIVKVTSYVDAVALRVTYTPPAVGQPYNIGEGLTNQTIIV